MGRRLTLSTPRWASRASVAEDRRSLLPAGPDGLLEVLCRHPDEQLGVPLMVHVGAQAAGIERGPQHPLAQLDPYLAEPDDAPGQLVAGVEQIGGGHDPGDE